MDKEIEGYAASVHAILAAGYILGLPYHYRRKNWGFLLINITGAMFHAISVFKHVKD